MVLLPKKNHKKLTSRLPVLIITNVLLLFIARSETGACYFGVLKRKRKKDMRKRLNYASEISIIISHAGAS